VEVFVGVAVHRDATHILDAAGDDAVAVPGRDGVRCRDDRLHRGGAPAVDRGRRYRFTEVREERDDAGDVVVLFGPLLGDPHIRSSTWSPVSPVSASVWSMRRVERSSLRTSA